MEKNQWTLQNELLGLISEVSKISCYKTNLQKLSSLYWKQKSQVEIKKYHSQQHKKYEIGISMTKDV